jgi:carbonic anhydrase
MNSSLEGLLENNRSWASRIENRTPGFFSSLLRQQAPRYLWIGCADSRVPANELVGLQPGELFVHRNIANVVAHSDLNCLSVVQYAVDQLQVEHVIVVGHSGCGGVRAALQGLRIGIADAWIRHVVDVHDRHAEWIEQVEADRRVDALCELNVVEQTRNVCRMGIVQDAWRRGQALVVHGWVYGLHNGRLNDLDLTISRAGDIEARYKEAVESVRGRYMRQAPLPEIRAASLNVA